MKRDRIGKQLLSQLINKYINIYTISLWKTGSWKLRGKRHGDKTTGLFRFVFRTFLSLSGISG